MPRPPGGGFTEDEATRADPNAAKLSLICRAGPITLGTVFGSDGAPITIGRSAGCAIVLPIALSSRKHSRIEYRGGRFWINDLDTLNGTRVNGELVREALVLEDDDIVEICGQQFQVRLGIVKGRKVVYDGFDALQVAKEIETEPLQVGQGARAPAWLPQHTPPPTQLPPQRVRPILYALVAILSAMVAAGVAVLVASRVERVNREQPRPAPLPPAPVVTPIGPVKPQPPPGPRPPAMLSAVDVLIVPTHASGVVKEIVPRGTPVTARETIANLEDSSVERKRKEFERLKAKFGDNDDYAEFIEQARLDLEKVHLTHILTPSAGIVVSTAVAEGKKIHRGDEVARIASRVELRVDAGAVSGSNASCKVTLKPGVMVDGTLSASVDGSWRTLSLSRLPPEIEPGPLADAHAACDGK